MPSPGSSTLACCTTGVTCWTRYGFAPPRTWHELVRIAQAIVAREPGMTGFVWQGKQYEGLVCNALEYVWSNGGAVLRDGRVVVDSPANREALAFMAALIQPFEVTPPSVTTATEEPSRLVFGQGRAVFLRNWPYAWGLFERAGSPVRGKVGVTVLPHFPGNTSAAALGGWQLAVNRHSKRQDAAAKLVAFLTAAEAQRALALAYGFQPTRVALYRERATARRAALPLRAGGHLRRGTAAPRDSAIRAHLSGAAGRVQRHHLRAEDA